LIFWSTVRKKKLKMSVSVYVGRVPYRLHFEEADVQTSLSLGAKKERVALVFERHSPSKKKHGQTIRVDFRDVLSVDDDDESKRTLRLHCFPLKKSARKIRGRLSRALQQKDDDDDDARKSAHLETMNSAARKCLLSEVKLKNERLSEQREKRVIRVQFGDRSARDFWQKQLSQLLCSAIYADGKPLLVMVNPFGGVGKARQTWDSVAPIFECAGVHVELLETEYAGHAHHFAMNEFSVDEYAGIVTVSGDGLLHEAINGLAMRPDWRRALSATPVGVIPAGSGNGLAAAICTLDPLTAAFNIAKGFRRPLDIVRTSQDGVGELCFLSINWAMISDVDFESEQYRWMGGVRFTVAAVVRLLNMRHYTGRISYLPANNEPLSVCTDHCTRCARIMASLGKQQSVAKSSSEAAASSSEAAASSSSSPDSNDDGEGEWISVEGDFALFSACNLSHISYDANLAPFAHLADGCMDMVFVRRTKNKVAMSSFMVDLEDGAHVSNELTEYHKVRAFMLEPSSERQSGMIGVDGERTKNGAIVATIMPNCVQLLGAC
jgi:diacylglycerol kinase family enzyme